MTDAAAKNAELARPASLPPGGSAAIAGGEARIATTGSDLGRIVWRGQFLTIVTLGIYRFWYRTDLRRWYWRNTVIDGDSFEYRGTPKELFIGFLIALAVTLPLYFGGAIAALLLASEAAGNIVTAIGLLALALLAQYGAYRSRRFRLTRTLWRGLRFDQSGSAWRYALVSFAWFIATVATAGLLLPLFRRALEEMKVRNTSFGTAAGRFSAPIGRLMAIWTPIWLLLLVLIGAAVVWFAAVDTAGGRQDAVEEFVPMALLAVAGAIAAFCLGWPIYRAAEFRAFTSGTAIGPVTFSSDLSASSLFGMYLKFGLVLIGLAIAALIAASVVFAALFVSLRQGAPSTVAIIGAAICYLGGIYILMCLKELILNQAFWRRAASSVSVVGLNAVAGVIATPGADESATGEGLADALDFGGV
ncbi:MAG: YjgN family protein [Beijerinckiaceae bacterium]